MSSEIMERNQGTYQMTSYEKFAVRYGTFLLLLLIVSLLALAYVIDKKPQPELILQPNVYSEFEPGFGLYIVNGIRITYDEISDSQYLICIDNHPVRIHETEQAAKEQMDRLLKYYKGES